MKSNRDSGHPHLVPDFSGNAANVSPLYKLLALGLSISILYREYQLYCNTVLILHL